LRAICLAKGDVVADRLVEEHGVCGMTAIIAERRQREAAIGTPSSRICP